MNLSDTIKKLRKESNLTQMELSQLTNIPYSTLRSYESGTREPSVQNFTALQKFFEVSAEYLRGETDQKIWDNTEIMDTVDNELSTYANSLIKVTREVSPKSRKLTMDILVELRHILTIEKNYGIDEFTSFLQYVFSASSGYIDSCMNAIKEDDDGTRIDNAIKNALLLYSSALNEVKDSIIDEKKDPQKK